MNLSRRGFLGLAGGALALAGCAAVVNTTGGTSPASSGSASTTNSGPVATIGLTYIPNIQFAPFYVAQARGLYSAGPGAVALRHHGASEGLFTALVAGQEDFVVAGADEMLQARSQGMDLVMVAQYYRSYPVVGIVKDASAIKTAADLKGHSIGLPGKYGSTWFALKVLLKGAGLAESDVTIVDTQYTQDAALQAGKVDAIMGFSNNDAVLLPVNGVPVRTIPLVASGQVPLVSVGLITTRAYLDAHGPLAKKIVDATTAGFVAAAKDPAGAVTTSADFVTTLKSDAAAKASAAKILDATIALWKDANGSISPTVDASQFSAMATFMASQGLLATAVDPASGMSNAYHS